MNAIIVSYAAPGHTMTIDPAVIIAASAAAFVVGLGKGGLALMGMMGVPIMSFVMSPIRAAAILLPVYVFSDVVAVWLYRRHFSVRNLKILIPAGCAGIAIGWATASRVPDRGVQILIGLIGLGFCFNTWRTRRHAPVEHNADLPRGLFWGTIMGFASFVSHSGGALYQVYVLPQRLPKLVYAGTNALVFAAMNVVKIGPYWALGQFTAPNLTESLYLLLPAFIGAQAGIRLVRILPARGYFAFIQVILFVVSAELIFKALQH
jgi:uncharacterized membrane protein YfcA